MIFFLKTILYIYSHKFYLGIKRALLNRMCRPISSRQWNTPRSGRVRSRLRQCLRFLCFSSLPQIFSEKMEATSDGDRPWHSYHTVYTNAKAGDLPNAFSYYRYPFIFLLFDVSFIEFLRQEILWFRWAF